MPVETPPRSKNESDRPAKRLLTVAPAGLEQRFFEAGVALAKERRPAAKEIETTARPPAHASKGQRMTDQKPETYRLLELFRPAAPVILTAFSGIVVWSFHNFGWPGFVAYLLVGFVAGSVTGGLVGVPLISTWAVMGMTGGLFEGVYQGWQHYGWVGSVLGGLVGVVGGIVVALLPTMLMSFVLVMCGIDPFVNADSGKDQKV